MFNKRLSAQEACERNLVNEVVADKEFQRVCNEKLEAFSKIPKMVKEKKKSCFNLSYEKKPSFKLNSDYFVISR